MNIFSNKDKVGDSTVCPNAPSFQLFLYQN